MTLSELIEAYKVDKKLNVDTVYESDPYDLLREALDLLGIPWEDA